MNPVLLLHHSMEACLDMEGWKEVGSKEEWQQGKEACIQKDEISKGNYQILDCLM